LVLRTFFPDDEDFCLLGVISIGLLLFFVGVLFLRFFTIFLGGAEIIFLGTFFILEDDSDSELDSDPELSCEPT
jgi:hypothetical protein